MKYPGAYGLLLMLVFLSCKTIQGHNPINKTDTLTRPSRKLYFTLKYGHGGFRDSRSPLGELGGGQLAICAQHIDYPVALSFSGEYYTNGPDPTHPYEIYDMWVINCYYSEYILKKKRLNIFMGPGMGRLKVPINEDVSASSILFTIDAGLNARLLWKFGLYASYKYLYANKPGKINFNEHILLIGITFNFRI